MRVTVCFKVTPDFEAFRDADWVAGPEDRVETRFVRRVLNCFDESALETALRLSDELAARGGSARLEAFTVGGRETEPFLKTLLALGYQSAARADAAVSLDFAPAIVASLVAGYVRRVGGADVVLLGCRSSPGDSGSVPFFVAEILGWPCVTRITEVEVLSDGHLRATCEADDGLLALTLRPPCVLGVGNAPISRLRVPTLTDRLARRNRSIRVFSGEDLGVDVAARLHRRTCTLTRLDAVRSDRPGVVIEGASPRDKAQVLFDEYLKPAIEAQ